MYKLRIVIIFQPQIGRKITILQPGPKSYSYRKKECNISIYSDHRSDYSIHEIVVITMMIVKTIMITISVIISRQ